MTTAAAARPATSADIAGMADSLAHAFHDDPVMTWLFGDTASRPVRYLRPFFAKEGARHLRHQEVFTIDGTPGAAYWDPPGHWRTAPRDILRMAPLLVRREPRAPE